MATRSRIGIELKDGSIVSSYHHWDGYPDDAYENSLQLSRTSSRVN